MPKYRLLQPVCEEARPVLSPILQEFTTGSGPSLEIITPDWISRCGNYVIVRGRVQDGMHPQGPRSPTELDSLWWEILDSEHRGRIRYNPDGLFEFAIPTLGLPQVFYLRIVATDSRGKSAERLFGMIAGSGVPPGGTIPAEAPPADFAEAAPKARVVTPVLTVTQPGRNDYFTDSLPVRGRLLDASGRVIPSRELESLTWEVEGTGLKGELEPGREGSFATVVDAAGVRQDALLVVRAIAVTGAVAEQAVQLRADISAPKLELRSPREGGSYDQTVTVEGSVADREAVSLHWQVLGAPGLGASFDLPEGGDFRFEIPTSRLEGIQIIELRAADPLGNATVFTVTLRGREPPVPVRESPAPTTREPAAPPQLFIESPVDRSYYHSQVRLEGMVEDAKSLTWEIPGSGLKGRVIAGNDGRFSLRIPSVDLQGTQMLRLIAVGHSGATVEKVLVLLDHEKGPEISIATPENRSYYRREILLEGSVGNPEDDWDSVGEVAGLSLRFAGAEDAPAEIPFDEQGHFSVLLPAEGYSGKLSMILTAEDRNGDLTRELITLLDGNLDPIVSISSPRVEQLYGSKVRVTGTVIDPYAQSEVMGGIESVSYSVTSPEIFTLENAIAQGAVELGADNSFDFVISTRDLSGPQDLNILVAARSGNQTKSSVRILEGEADIPVFSVEPGDRRAVLRWDPLPSVRSYTLSYRSANPGQRQGRVIRVPGISSPYVLAGLENGNRYVFTVEAELPGEPNSRSAEKWAIPLSPETLRPATAGEFQQIRVSWPSRPGCERYILWRAFSADGKYLRIGEALTETNYLDTNVRYGRSYYYRVSPASVPENPSEPVLGQSTAFAAEKLEAAGMYPTTQSRDLTLYGGYAFVAQGGEGIKIVDISSPASPALVGGFQTADAQGIAVRGEYAFVADGERGLKVLDISDPRYPAEAGMRKTMDARAVALAGDVAFVADGSSGVKVIDVSSPVQPTRLGSVATENACDLVVNNDTLYVADGRGGLKIFDTSASPRLTELGQLAGLDVRAVAVQGSLLFLAAGADGLIVMDRSTPGAPVELGRYTEGEILDVELSGTFAYLMDRGEGMIVVDVSDPGRPTRFASFEAEGASSVAVQGHYAYLATESGLQVVHILIQGRSVPVASGRIGGKAFGLSVFGQLAFIACHDQGVRVIDVSDPQTLGDESTKGAWSEDYAVGIEVIGSIAYVAGGRRGLSILDLSPLWVGDSTTQPKRTGSYYTGGTAHRTSGRPGLLFVADGQEGLKILDIGLPNSPVEIASVSSRDARDVALMGEYALVADADSGLIVYAVADPVNPIALVTLESPGAQRIVLQDTLVAVAGSSGVDLYDFSDPGHPAVLGRYESEYVEGIFLRGQYLYIAEGHRGLTVLDVRSYDPPVLVSACPDIYAVDVAVHAGYALVTDSRQIHAVEILIPEWLRAEAPRR